MKRGQVTLLVIIGIILLFSVSILLYFSRISYTANLQAQAQATVNDFVESNSLSQYITTCLQRVATEGVDLLSKQGGVIYTSQGGRIPTPTGPLDYTHVDYQGYNVSYAIKDIGGQCSSYRPDILDDWRYPVENIPFNEFKSRFESVPAEQGCRFVGSSKDLRKSGFLGYNTFSYLCTPETGNEIDYNALPLQRNIICQNRYQEPTTFIDETPSLETQLEWYIEDNMPNCFDISIYEQVGDEVTVDQENFDAQVYFTDPRGIFIRSTFPFEVSIKGQKPIVELVNFQQQIDLNVLDTYNFMYELILQMTTNVSFYFPDQSYEEWTSYRGKNLQVELFPARPDDTSNLPNSPVYDDILRITDLDEEFNGEPYYYQVALRQRRPILDYISQGDFTGFPFFDENGNPITVDFVILPGQALEFQVQAIDPNYDSIDITIEGWKETQDSVLNVECCLTQTCTLQNIPDVCMITTEEEPFLNMANCRADVEGCFNNIGNTNNDFFYTTTEPYQPHELQYQIQENDGFVRYEPTDTDSGLHHLRVIVTDDHGSYDFQDLYVLVYDVPIAHLEPRNLYDDISNSHASIEDPYILDPSNSQASAFSQDQEFSAFFYRIHYEGYDSNGETLEFYSTENEPYILPFANYQIRTILTDNLSADAFNYVQPGEQLDVSLIVNQELAGTYQESLPTVEQIYLHQCLPHGFDRENAITVGSNRLIDYYDIDAYGTASNPYYEQYFSSTNQETIFQLPHVCCEPNQPRDDPIGILEGGSYASPNEVCYDITKETCFPPLTDTAYFNTFLNSPATEDQEGNIIPLNQYTFSQRYPAPAYATGTNPPYSNAINDVWTLTQEQYCSGSRGNTCSGDIELTWTLAESCTDLDASIGQFARCQAPGINFAGNGCYDATADELRCMNYGRGSTYERNSRGIRTGAPGYNSQTATFIGQGFCSGPRRANLNQIQAGNIVPSTTGDFTCYGTCSGGGCSYDASACLCQDMSTTPTETFSPLRMVDARDFLNGADFVCRNGVAYNNQCQGTVDSAAACYCQTQTNQNIAAPITQTQLNNFNGYFGNKNTDWQVTGGTCCAAGVFATHTGPAIATGIQTSICFDGQTVNDQPFVYPSVSPDPKFLAFEGKVYYCAQGNAEDFLVLATFATQRAHITNTFYSNTGTPAGIASWICTDAGWVNS